METVPPSIEEDAPFDVTEWGRLVDGELIWNGSLGPTSGSPDRAPGSVRRTSTVDMIWANRPGGPLVLEGRARDLYTDEDGTAHVVGTASTVVTIERGQVVAVETDPPIPTEGLLGQPANRFRWAIAANLPELSTDGSLLGLLLDETPVTTLISGHSRMRNDPGFLSDASKEPAPESRPAAAATPAPSTSTAVPVSLPAAGEAPRPRRVPINVCIGWAEGGFMDVNIARRRKLPRSYKSVTVPPLTREDDPLAWHELPPLGPTSMRRNRRMDVVSRRDGGYDIDGLFRDQYVDLDGRVTGVHEYAMKVETDLEGTLVSVEATPRVLPGPECPGAVASAARLLGHDLAEVRAMVRAEFSGTTTCTHLNDELRSLGDAHALLAHL